MSDRSPGLPHRIATFLYRHPRLQLRLVLAAPLLWLLLAYIGSLAILFANAFFRLDPFTGQVVFEPTLDNFATVIGTEVYRTITLRTVALAAIVTLTCALIGFPIAYYMARVASPRVRGLLIVAVLMPLWVSYLVKVYAWRTMLIGNGVLDWLLEPIGLGTPGFGEVALWLVFTYLWLPYMILPIYAGLERIPGSLIEASFDLGARGGHTFRRVILPLALPAVVAGSIFTFSLTLGDYITPDLVSNTRLIGNAIYDSLGVPNLPLAAAIATVPVVIVVIYLLLARRTGAFESL
ncbi:MAG TPA: ABC transporter permease [Candidatus Limnocylindria bacterium]|nr:ABC transporter permease [Candidatus Limnocylindria bacterium]